MTPEKKLRVVIVGASGETGSSVMDALLASPDQFESVALARPESINKEILQDFVRRGASVQPANFQNVEGLLPSVASRVARDKLGVCVKNRCSIVVV